MREGDYRVLVGRLSKTAWETGGRLQGRSLRVEYRTAAMVLKRWGDAATHKRVTVLCGRAA